MTADRRTVLVTGVHGGIGHATALEFRRDRWFVIGTDRVAHGPEGDETATDQFVQIDLALPQAVNQLIDQLGLERLDALVNNAAVQANFPVHETSDEVFDEVLTTNLRVPFQLIRELVPALAATKGSIVNVSSIHAVVTSANVAAYAVSKGALVSLTRSAAIDLAPLGIRCNAVLPGAVKTAMLMDGLGRRPHERGSEGNLEDLEARTPLRYVAGPAAIAPTIVLLADSRRSPYTTGQSIILDGGAAVRLSTE